MNLLILIISIFFITINAALADINRQPHSARYIPIAENFGRKILELKKNDVEEVDLFKEYGIGFPGKSEVKLEKVSEGYVLKVVSIPSTVDLVEATCRWHNLHSPWFTAEMLCPVSDRAVNEARWAAISGILLEMRAEKKVNEK